MTKQEVISQYNKNNPSYNITNIKKMTQETIDGYRKYNAHSLNDLYAKPSQAKIDSYNDILRDYNPIEIIAVQGACYSYGVILQASNGDILHITKSNNYLVEREG